MLISARSFDEYRAMFALSEDDLGLRILDCPGGAASFAAEAGARGTDVVAVDPQYGPQRHLLGKLAQQEIEHKHRYVADHASSFVWNWFGDAERYTRLRARSARAFATDIAARPDRYVEATLPQLPFPDRSFDLVLSSHLLFSYGAQLSEEFHLSALLELVRVARREVRLFPVVLHTSDLRYAALDRLRDTLDGLGVPSRLDRVGYEFQPGGNETLVLDCADHGPLPTARPGGDARDPVRWRHLEAAD
ncbi:class I SAM-dependent methyltransferase [Streptomyces sp. NBC_01387]|uniref:methyltransferase domain-containing protein n=1 Tax=unclassified Streptomyces TaxID=2593676 RepID=UPI002023F656|nr:MULTISPECIES: methyltransferase domain-containing protein [unclassified Streptomyces]MCX4552686.1 class I SAM-dependent methyltransferase [Streptomyces sp. NBC_01500]WSC24026.1 class I SAM-dependent methyltransferase [Streptomyces sp. NBC_01766]WSV57909.1 class I SAM-dependent methyltransferase [Streptomyces sp. NBC_01014]